VTAHRNTHRIAPVPGRVSPRRHIAFKRRTATAETGRKFDQDFKEGAVRLVRETGKPIAQVARDLGIRGEIRAGR
jgi:transposase-like protein